MTQTITVAVIGAGTMGRGIASLFARAGHRVRVFDGAPGVVADWLAATTITDPPQDITDAGSLAGAVEHADLVVEAVAENLEVKRVVLNEVSDHAPRTAVIATNTSSFPIDTLAAHCEDPARFVGTHFFNPADIIPGVEVIPGEATSSSTVDQVMGWLSDAGKRPATVRSSPGFIANRLQMALFLECLSCVEEGLVSPEDLDTVVMTTFGFRLPLFGPFAIADMAGLDVYESILKTLQAGYGDRFAVPEAVSSRTAVGDFGTKTGKGFAEYEDGAREKLIRHRDKMYVRLGEVLDRP